MSNRKFKTLFYELPCSFEEIDHWNDAVNLLDPQDPPDFLSVDGVLFARKCIKVNKITHRYPGFGSY